MKKHQAFFFLALFFSFQYSLYAHDLSLQEGDVIGESEIIEDSSTSFIEAATKSRFGHVGVVLKYNNELMVFEEYPPEAEVVSVDEFLGRLPGRFAVIRKTNAFSALDLESMKTAGLDLIQKKYPYNYSQVRNDSSMNCSEFVNFLFSKIGLSVGKVETIGDQNLKAFMGYPWILWRIGDRGIKKTDEVITPKSVMQTPGWVQVAGDLNPNDNLSDRELYQQWKNENASHGVAKEWYLFERELKWMSKF